MKVTTRARRGQPQRRQLAALLRLRLEPDDVLVVLTEGQLSMDQADRVEAYVKHKSGHGRVLVVDDGSKLAILSRPATREVVS